MIMDYYYDCEFLEGTQKRRIGKIELSKMFDTKNTIDLISIGIVDQEDREYYAVSKDFNLKEAWYRYDLVRDNSVGVRIGALLPYKKVYWIRENVLKPIFEELLFKAAFDRKVSPTKAMFWDNKMTYKNLKTLIKIYGKTNKQIAEEVYNFMNPDLGFHVSGYNNSELKEGGRLHNHFELHDVTSDGEHYYAQPKLHGYYSSYDHVVFCWLFGKMKDLPKGFPMFTFDLKQEFDRVMNNLWFLISYKNGDKRLIYGSENTSEYINKVFDNKREMIKALENNISYPKQTNEHHALSDAKWNKQLHTFIKNL